MFNMIDEFNACNMFQKHFSKYTTFAVKGLLYFAFYNALDTGLDIRKASLLSAPFFY